MHTFKYLCLLGSLLLVILIASDFHPAEAQQLAPATISNLKITTLDNRPVDGTSLMAGATYKIDFTMAVAAGLKENCTLTTSLTRASGSDRFWTLNNSYAGIDSSTWQPGEQTITFNAVQGTAQMELEGSVPADYTTQSLSDGQTLHIAKNIPVVTLSLGSGTVVANQQMEVIDSSIENFNSALSAKQGLVTTTKADPAYVSLVKALLTSAQAEAAAGRTDVAMQTLNAIPTSGWIQPPSGSTSYQWIIMGILAVLLAACVFLLIKARNELSFFRRQTDSQARNLQILAKKASRVGDPSLSAGIEQMRKEMEHSIGGNL